MNDLCWGMAEGHFFGVIHINIRFFLPFLLLVTIKLYCFLVKF